MSNVFRPLKAAKRATHVPAIFRPMVPDQKVAVLFLIENSEEMSSIWHDLRDQHLPTLLTAIRDSNPGAEIDILSLPSLIDDQNPVTLAPRPCYELPEVRFNYRPGNNISVGTISCAIDMLNSTFQGWCANRHLVIVAASTPSDDMDAVNSIHVPQNGGSGWHLLASKLTQSSIHCHMVLNPNNEMNAFTLLFYEALRLQGCEEIAPWFVADPEKYLFRLSAKPDRSDSHGDVPVPPYMNLSPCSYDEVYPSERFPVDTHIADEVSPAMSSMTEEVQADPTEPSLVARLQQVHGLTKKKIYTSKPNRTPFFRDEPVRDKYRQSPTPLSIPISPSVSPLNCNRDGQGSSRSRTASDRFRRISGRVLQGNSANPQPRLRSPWPCRASPVSSPESDATLSSPTSVSNFSKMSPVLPVHDYMSSNVSSPASPCADDMHVTPTTQTPVTMNPLMSYDPTIGVTDPTWLQEPFAHVSSPLTPDRVSLSSSMPFPSFPDTKGSTVGPFQSTLTSGYHSLETAAPPIFNMDMKAAQVDTPTRTNSQPFPVSSPQRPVAVDGDSPFIFSPEYEAATEARMADLKSSSISRYSVLPARHNSLDNSLHYAPPMNLRNSYPYLQMTSRSSTSSSAPSSRVDLTYGQSSSYVYPHDQLQMPTQITPSMDASLGASYSLAGSSSLTGWAG